MARLRTLDDPVLGVSQMERTLDVADQQLALGVEHCPQAGLLHVHPHTVHHGLLARHRRQAGGGRCVGKQVQLRQESVACCVRWHSWCRRHGAG